MNCGLILLIVGLATIAYGKVIVPKAPFPDGRIVGGEDTTIEKFPFQVSVQLLGSHYCGGSILNSRIIVTAGHCIYIILGPDYYSINYGSTEVGRGQTVMAERLVKHEKYDAGTADYDIGLIYLKSEIKFSSVAQPISMASNLPPAGTTVAITGWGAIVEGGGSPSTLQKVEVQIVDSKVCNEQYIAINEITDRMFCAGQQGGGKDACQGDSGGPVVVNNELLGIVSWGEGCARPDYAGVYSSVPYLKAWVVENSPHTEFL